MDKPFKTRVELMELLESRGLITDNRTEYLLEKEGYYAIVNGYKDDFLAVRGDEERYKDGADFFEIYALFVMDRHLRAILFRYITLAEAALKSICTYQFCMKYCDNNEAYLDAANYRIEEKYRVQVERLIGELNQIIGRGSKKPKYMKEYLSHYIKHHDNIPLWVVMNSMSLGQAYKYYDLQQESVRFAVAQRFQALYKETHSEEIRITHKKLGLAFNTIKDFRNLCAHDERLYCSRVGLSGKSFADCIECLSLVMSKEQYDSLICDVGHQIEIAGKRIHTISRMDILKRMGYTDSEARKTFGFDCEVSSPRLISGSQNI